MLDWRSRRGTARAAVVTRVVHELLLNVAKHSGANSATVAVSDAGQGFDPRLLKQVDAGGFGLTSIQDQVEFEGGSCEIDSAPGAGCRVWVRVALTD